MPNSYAVGLRDSPTALRVLDEIVRHGKRIELVDGDRKRYKIECDSGRVICFGYPTLWILIDEAVIKDNLELLPWADTVWEECVRAGVIKR